MSQHIWLADCYLEEVEDDLFAELTEAKNFVKAIALGSIWIPRSFC
jgi:hypothetical protein